MEKLKEVKVLMTGINNDVPYGVEQPTIKELADKINEIVEFCNSVSKLIDYADNERERDKGN